MFTVGLICYLLASVLVVDTYSYSVNHIVIHMVIFVVAPTTVSCCSSSLEAKKWRFQRKMRRNQ